MRVPTSFAFGLMCLLAVAVQAQQSMVHIGYVYPAGAQQGTEFEAVVAGQFLTGVEGVYVSGGGVEAVITELVQPISGRELNQFRVEIGELMAKRAVARNDFKALEQFKSFKNAKSLESGNKDDGDSEIEALKNKYAGATWTREDERRLMEIRKKMTTAVRRPANPAISELAVVRFRVASDAEPGRRELRIASPLGLSNPLTFCVGRLPEVSEAVSKEITQQKSAIAKTSIAPKNRKGEPEMTLSLPAVINGQIMPGEVDRYRFAASKGQRLVIAAAARQLIPYLPDGVPGWFQATLALYDARGKELAYDDDFRFNPDPVLAYRIPADGEYSIEIKDAIYRGREDFVYRITLGELPLITSVFPLGGPAAAQTTVSLIGWNLPAGRTTIRTGTSPGIQDVAVASHDSTSNLVPFAVDTLPESLEQEPNDGQSSAEKITPPVIVNGRIDSPEDVDVFCFEARAGSEIVAEVNARRLNSPVDSLLKLTDASGNALAANDDHEDQGAGLTTHHADSYLHATIPADGIYYLRLSDAQHKGGPEYGYRLRISPPRPDFELRIVPSSISIRFARTVPITAYALRKDGFSGDIRLTLKDAPEGCTLSGGRIPCGEDRVQFTLTVPSHADKEVFNLSLEGHAIVEGREISRPAVPTEDMMQAFEYRHLVPVRQLVVAALGRAPSGPGARILSDTPVKIPVGGTATVRLLAPATRYRGKVKLELNEPPQGIVLQDVSASAAGTEVVFRSDATSVKPGMKGNLILTASLAGAGSGKTRAPASRGRTPALTLPAIEFDVVDSVK